MKSSDPIGARSVANRSDRFAGRGKPRGSGNATPSAKDSTTPEERARYSSFLRAVGSNRNKTGQKKE